MTSALLVLGLLVLVLLLLALLGLLCLILILINASHTVNQVAERARDVAANGIHSPHYYE